MFNNNTVTFTLDTATYLKLHELVSQYNCTRSELLKIWINETYIQLKENPDWLSSID